MRDSGKIFQSFFPCLFFFYSFLISLSLVEIKHMASLHNKSQTCTGRTLRNWWGCRDSLHLCSFEFLAMGYTYKPWATLRKNESIFPSHFFILFYFFIYQPFFDLVWWGPEVKELSHNALLCSTRGRAGLNHFTNQDLKWSEFNQSYSSLPELLNPLVRTCLFLTIPLNRVYTWLKTRTPSTPELHWFNSPAVITGVFLICRWFPFVQPNIHII